MTIDDSLKMKLAVTAHIRHRFTNYDAILSEPRENYPDRDVRKIARSRVKKRVEDVAEMWRGTTMTDEDMASGVPINISDFFDDLTIDSEVNHEERRGGRSQQSYSSSSRIARQDRAFDAIPALRPNNEHHSHRIAAVTVGSSNEEGQVHELRESRISSYRSQRCKELADRDLYSAKRHRSHISHITPSRVRQMNKQQTVTRDKDWADLPIKRPTNAINAQRGATVAAGILGLGRVAKSVRNKENRAKTTLEDLQHYLSQVRFVREHLIKDPGSQRINESIREEIALKPEEDLCTKLCATSLNKGTTLQHSQAQDNNLT